MTPFLAQRSRSDRAFERMYQRHVGDVYRYALVVLRNPVEAEDVTQTTFMNAYRAFARGERPRAAQNWLIAIAHNVCRQRFRQAQRRPAETPLDDQLVEAPPEPDDDAPSAADIRRALGHLAFNQRAALVMRELEGRSYTEIAAVLELSTSAVETLIFRARRALREQLEGTLTCQEAELAVSKQLDDRLGRKEKGQLRAHLRECDECARFARSQRAQRSAIRGLAAIPIPTSLAHFFGHGGGAAAAGATATAGAGAGVGTIFGGGALVKVALVGAAAVAATGVGIEAARRTHWHPLRDHRLPAVAARALHRSPAARSQAARAGAFAAGGRLGPRAGHGIADNAVSVNPVETLPAVKGARPEHPKADTKPPPLFPPGQSGKSQRIDRSHAVKGPAKTRSPRGPSAKPLRPASKPGQQAGAKGAHKAPHGSVTTKLNPPSTPAPTKHKDRLSPPPSTQTDPPPPLPKKK